MTKSLTRCGWLKLSDPVYVEYRDTEWGRPLHDETALFDLEKVASYGDGDIERILNSGVAIKSRPKIEAIIENAKRFVEIKREHGSLDAYFWGYVGGKQITNSVRDYKTAACTSETSDKLTKDLKKRGFKFVGSTTVYAFMQACGMVDDHEDSCFCKAKL